MCEMQCGTPCHLSIVWVFVLVLVGALLFMNTVCRQIEDVVFWFFYADSECEVWYLILLKCTISGLGVSFDDLIHRYSADMFCKKIWPDIFVFGILIDDRGKSNKNKVN